MKKSWINDATAKTPAMKAVDQMFLDKALRALSAAKTGALAYLSANPDASIIDLARDLAKQSNEPLSAIGLIMAVYKEAVSAGVVRQIAMDLLFRKIREEFPKGWSSVQGEVRASVILGSWDWQIKQHVSDPKAGEYASRLIKQLTIEQPPAAGWKPQGKNDAFLQELFDCHWPLNSK